MCQNTVFSYAVFYVPSKPLVLSVLYLSVCLPIYILHLWPVFLSTVCLLVIACILQDEKDFSDHSISIPYNWVDDCQRSLINIGWIDGYFSSLRLSMSKVAFALPLHVVF